MLQYTLFFDINSKLICNIHLKKIPSAIIYIPMESFYCFTKNVFC